jgi:peptidoglycan/LPS O-acetylase OafA/YrhL
VVGLLYRVPLVFITAGHSAVILFFILSGFVLSIPAVRGKAQTYPVFLIRRIFRIYFPYIVALAFAVWGAAKLHGYIPGSIFLQEEWSRPVDWHLVLQHALFIGTYDATQFNTVFWSLIVEMRVSLIFPALCASALWLKPGKSLALATLLSLCSFLLYLRVPHLGLTLTAAPYDLASTPHYAGIFVVGIYLARRQQQISEFYASLSRSRKAIFAILSILLFYSEVPATHLLVRLGEPSVLLRDWPTAAGAAGLVVLSLNSESCRRMLLLRSIRFLGRVSYSMYLIHATILFALVHLLYDRVPMLAILPLYLAATLIASAILYRVVEKPFMEWGRQLSSHLLPKASNLPQVSVTPVANVPE